jgi:hypothetical protein
MNVVSSCCFRQLVEAVGGAGDAAIVGDGGQCQGAAADANTVCPARTVSFVRWE